MNNEPVEKDEHMSETAELDQAGYKILRGSVRNIGLIIAFMGLLLIAYAFSLSLYSHTDTRLIAAADQHNAVVFTIGGAFCFALAAVWYPLTMRFAFCKR